jgi:23S rRNA pseudouridine1911/1915/1917 synthase
VVARTAVAYDSLVAQLAARTVRREYVTVVWGVPSAARGVIDAPIGRSTSRRTRMAVRTEGRAARTEYAVEETFDEPACARLVCRLETGRTHQIRVHLAAIGHPVVGDPAYGGTRPQLTIGRPFLHAATLAFDHPRTGDEVRCVARLPSELEQVLAHLRAAARP